MQIINRLFPYPIFSIDVDDYKDNYFEADISDIAEKENQLSFTIGIKINNEAVITNIINGNIDVVVHIECSKTSFRTAIKLGKKEKERITISSSKLNGTVEICCFLIAANKFILDSKMGLNEDYKTASFEMKVGTIVGYYNADKIIIEKDTDELLKPSSIFSVVKKKDAELPFEVKLDDSKRIKIILNEETYMQFIPLQNENCLPIIHGVIVLPALVYTLERLKESHGNLEEYEDKSWFLAIEKQLSNLEIDLYNGGLESKSSIVVAQQLLQLPVNKALDKIARLGGE